MCLQTTRSKSKARNIQPDNTQTHHDQQAHQRVEPVLQLPPLVPRPRHHGLQPGLLGCRRHDLGLAAPARHRWQNAGPVRVPTHGAAPVNPAPADPAPVNAAPAKAVGPSAEQIGALVKTTIANAIAPEKKRIQAEMATLERDGLDLTDAVNAMSAHQSVPLHKEQVAIATEIRMPTGLLQEAEQAAPPAEFPLIAFRCHDLKAPSLGHRHDTILYIDTRTEPPPDGQVMAGRRTLVSLYTRPPRRRRLHRSGLRADPAGRLPLPRRREGRLRRPRLLHAHGPRHARLRLPLRLQRRRPHLRAAGRDALPGGLHARGELPAAAADGRRDDFSYQRQHRAERRDVVNKLKPTVVGPRPRKRWS